MRVIILIIFIAGHFACNDSKVPTASGEDPQAGKRGHDHEVKAKSVEKENGEEETTEKNSDLKDGSENEISTEQNNDGVSTSSSTASSTPSSTPSLSPSPLPSPSPSPSTSPLPPTCSGVSLGGYCWYLSAANASCDSTCSTHGGSHAATLTYVGSDGPPPHRDENCRIVLDALKVPVIGVKPPIYPQSAEAGAGCSARLSTSDRFYLANPPTVSNAAISGVSRACACNR